MYYFEDPNWKIRKLRRYNKKKHPVSLKWRKFVDSLIENKAKIQNKLY